MIDPNTSLGKEIMEKGVDYDDINNNEVQPGSLADKKKLRTSKFSLIRSLPELYMAIHLMRLVLRTNENNAHSFAFQNFVNTTWHDLYEYHSVRGTEYKDVDHPWLKVACWISSQMTQYYRKLEDGREAIIPDYSSISQFLAPDAQA